MSNGDFKKSEGVEGDASETPAEQCTGCGIWTPVHRNFCMQCREKNNNFSPATFSELFGVSIEEAKADCTREHAMIAEFLEDFIEDFPYCDLCGAEIKSTPPATK